MAACLNLLPLCLLVVSAAAYGKIFPFKIGIPPAGPPDARARAPVWGTIVQKLDNFDPENNSTWTMRYMANDQWYQPGGPMFVFLGGEWEISGEYLMTGQIYDMARDHNGYMFYTEHRYYGESYPTPDYTTANLKWLSVKQALADLAHFIRVKKQTVPGLENSKVVVVGGSYSANMATWARLKHPDVIDIAYASSAPLRAVLDFYEYFEVLSNNIELVDSECLDIIEEAISETDALLETAAGIRTVSGMFNTCGLVDTTEPARSFFFYSVGSVLSSIVQYAAPGDIQMACDFIKNSTADTSAGKLGQLSQTLFVDCMPSYQDFLDLYATTQLTRTMFRQWFYQTCAEFGYYQTTTSANQPFGRTIPIEMFYRMCVDLHGPGFDAESIGRAVESTNLEYGALAPNVTEVVSVHGTVDPWHALGLLEDLSAQAPSIVVTGTSHCADLSSVSAADPPNLVQAKTRVKELIAIWLA